MNFKTKQLILFVTFIISNTLLYSQNLFQKLQGTNGDQLYPKIFHTASNEHILFTRTNYSTYGNVDYLLYKINSDGNILWSKKLGANNRDLSKFILSNNGSIFTFGWRGQSSSIDDMHFMEIDENGNVLNQKTWGESDDDELHAVCALNTGEFAIFGGSRSYIIEGQSELFYTVMDQNLDIGTIYIYSTTASDIPRSATQGDGNSVYTVGYTLSGSTTVAFIAKINLDGTLQWSKKIGNTTNSKYWDIIESSDSKYICVGELINPSTSDKEMIIVKYNDDGTIAWSKSFTLGTEGDCLGYKIKESHNGNYIVSGTKGDSGNEDVFLMEFDNSGNFLFGNFYGGDNSEINPDFDYFQSDYGYLLVNESTSYDGSGININLIKTDNSGNSCCNVPIQNSGEQTINIISEDLNFQTGSTTFTNQGITFSEATYPIDETNICFSPVTISGNDTVGCGQSSYVKYTVNINEIANFDWYVTPPATIVNNVNDTTIYVNFNGQSATIYLTSGNCNDTLDSLNVTVYGDISVNLGPDSLYCNIPSVTLHAGNSFDSYLWQNGSTDSTITVYENGTYWVYVTDAAGCSGGDTVNISFFRNTVYLGNDTTLCSGDPLTLDAGTGFNFYAWNTGQTSQSITVSSSGTYDVLASYEHCNSYDDIVVDFIPAAFAYAGSNEAICEDESFDFNDCSQQPNASNNNGVHWIGGSGYFSDPNILKPIYYPAEDETGNITLSLIAYSTGGCPNDTASMTLTINERPVADFNTPGSTLCQENTIVFNDNSTTTINSWLWDFGDGNTSSTGPSTSNIYLNAGTYPVNLTVVNSNGCSDDTTINITINELPLVDFTYSPDNSICVSEIISFSNLTTGTISGYNWNFGDGATSTTQNPTHSYSSSGYFNTKLTATNTSGCIDSLSQVIEINPLPEPVINITPGNIICAETTVTFSGSDIAGTTITSWDWEFGDGQTGTGQSLDHYYDTPGDYIVTMSALNNNNCESSTQVTIHVNSLPQSTFTISPNDTSCMGESVAFNAIDITGDIDNWQWQFGDGQTGSGQNTSHTYSQQGDMSVLSIYTNNNGCVDTTINTRYVMDVNIGFDITQSPTCQNYNVDFTGTGDRITFTPWDWQFGDGATATGIDVSHTYTTADTINVILNVCSEQSVQQLIINATCNVYAGQDTATCQDVYYDFSESYDTPTASNYTSVYWFTDGVGYFDNPAQVAPTYFPDPSEGVTQNDTLTMMMVGYGLLPCENDTSYTHLVVIPGAYAQAGSDEYICEGEYFDFNTSQDSAFATHYAYINWSTSGTGYFNDPTIMRPIYFPGPGELGDVTLTMVAANIINCDSIDDMILTIHPTYEMPVDITVCHYDSAYLEGAWRYNSGVFYDTLHTAYYGCDSVIVTNFTVRPKIDMAYSISTGDSICFGETCIFDTIGSADLSGWQWDFGDGNTSSQILPQHTYSSPGIYEIIFSYTDINGCYDSTVHNVRVFALPDVSYITSFTNACVGSAISFTGASNSNILSWEWDFGDGDTGSGQTVAHTYTTWGNMYATLTVTDDHGCTNTYTELIVIAEPPVADFTYTPAICDSIQFTDLSTCSPGYNLVEWYWDFGDGTTDTLQNPSHRYPSNTIPGGEVFMVNLVVAADSLGFICTDSITLPVTVPSLPDIFPYIDPSPTCFGDTTYFSGHSGFPIETWHWDFGDGNFSNDSITSHLYATADTFNVTLNIIDTNQCTNSATEVLIVKPAPAVSFTMSDSVICKGGPVYFNATGSANVDEWYWEFGDGGISYLQNPVHYYPSGNTYTVTLTVTDSTGCSSTASDVIMVLPGPTADFSYANQSCTAVAFFDDSDIPTGYFATEFFWDFGDGFTSDLQNPVHSYTTGISTYDVMFVVTADSSGYSCSDTTYQTIYTPGLPSVFFTWDPEPTMLGNTTNFYGNSGNTITDWNWDFHDGTTSTDQNPAHVFPTVGTFNVELTVTDIEGCENTVTHLVTVVNIPDLDYEWSYACLGEQIQFTILDPPTDIGAVTSWDWDFGDGSTSSDMEPIHTYAASGTYNVSCSIVDTMGATNTVIKQLTVNPLPNSLFNIGTQVCANNPVEFFDHSTTQTGYITEWFWEFGDGSDTTVYFGGDPNVTHIYSGTSTYTVTLTVTNSDSCSNSSTHTVTTEPGPIALFDYNSGCASGPVSFTDESTVNGGGEIVTWLWDFGDPGSGASNTSTLQNPVHLFSAPGDYTVLLMVANINGCEDTVSHTVTVSEEPEVDFTWEANCLTEETQFTVDESVTNVGEVATWSWSFGDGGTSNLQNPTHTYEVAGTFDVILSIETTDGCFASVTHSVNINPLPTANFAHTGPSCLNDTVYFSNLSSSPNGLIETWVWDFGDGNEITINAPDNPNVEHMYANEGTFDVVLTVTDAEGCENDVTKQVVIVSSPIADFNWNAGCLNEPVQFTDISSTNGGPDIGQWEWYFGDPASGTNNTSNLPNPTHVFSTDSTFTVTLIIHNTMGCTDTVEHEIVITALPDVDFTIESDTICLGSLAQFTGISNSEIATWYWQFGDGGTSIEQNPGYGYQQAGTYTVTLTVTDVSGCENSTSQEVHVNYAPEALFSYDNACLGDSTSFTDFSYTNNGYINNWSWDFGDGNTSDETDPVHTYTTNDTYYVTLIVWDNSGCSDSITLPVQVFDVPVPAFNFAQACDPPGQVNFFNESVMGSDNSPITGYEWHLDDGYYSDEVDPSYIYEITDTCYQVTLTAFNNNGCSATDTMEVCVFGAIETSFEATDVCLGQPTEFQAFYGPENDSVASYLWNFHDGSQTELTYHDTISHTFPAPGIYLVELIATDTNDCQAIYTSEITIDSLPVASFTNTIGGCEIPTYFEGVTYSGGEFIESWYWDFGDTTSTNNTDSIWNPTHLYGPNDSTYLVQLIVTNYNGCIDTVVQEVYVAPCITAGFKVPDEPVCARNELFFVDTSFLVSNNGMIGTWLWDFGDGTTETYDVFTDTVWHTYADAGTYELSLTITAGIDTNSYTTTTMVEFEVHPTPLPMIGLENNCQRDTTYVSDNSTIFGEPTTYRLWNFGDPTTEADTSNVQDPKYVYPTFESYPVSLFVQNKFICADSTKDTITIYKLPEAQFTYQNTCMSYYTQFEETSIADSAVIASWFWNFGDTLKAPADTAIIQAPQYIYDSAGMYTVEMIITDEHLCMDTATTTVEIMPKPISEFVMIDTNRQGQVYFDNLSTNNPVDYEWDFDYNQGIWTSNDINPIFQYEEDGNYTVMLVSWNQQGCPDTTYQVYDLLFTNLFVPNTFVPSSPITDLQTFKPVGINLSSYKLEVYSAWGNLVFETTELIDGVPSEGWDGTYEGEPLPTGSYVWRIEAVFEDGSHWRGTDNGDGNTGTSGTIMLVR